MTTPTTIHAALVDVMRDVRAVGKDDLNHAQKFRFRGIDAVINAVGPALRAHGVITLPQVEHIEYAQMPLRDNRSATVARVHVRYSFVGPAGDRLDTLVAAEAFDTGDKATAKAMSVAYRTALLQALALPTDEPDPDEYTYETDTCSFPFHAALEAVKGAPTVRDLELVLSAARSELRHYSTDQIAQIKAASEQARAELHDAMETMETADA